MEIKQPRKVIQLTAIHQHEGDDLVVALCDDGSIWVLSNIEGWEQIADVPQYD